MSICSNSCDNCAREHVHHLCAECLDQPGRDTLRAENVSLAARVAELEAHAKEWRIIEAIKERDSLRAELDEAQAANKRLLTSCHLSSGSSVVRCGECAACLKAQLAERDRDYSGSATVAAMDALKAQLAFERNVNRAQETANTSLRAQLAFSEQQNQNRFKTELRAGQHIVKLEAQLAEAQTRTEQMATRYDIARRAQDAAEEQLRVAKEALGEAAGALDRLRLDSAAQATYLKCRALSASAPKAEPCHETKEECDAATAADHAFFDRLKALPPLEHGALAGPSQATPVCDDVTLMKVAKAVREACVNACVGVDASRSFIRCLDLAAIVAQVKR